MPQLGILPPIFYFPYYLGNHSHLLMWTLAEQIVH